MNQTDSLVLNSSYFRMPYVQRLACRALLAGVFGFAAAVSIVFVQGPSAQLRAAGLFLILVLADTGFHAVRGNRAITSETLRMFGSRRAIRVNDFFLLRSFRFLDASLTDAELAQSAHTCLFMFKRMLREDEIRRGMMRLGIAPGEFSSDLDKKIQAARGTCSIDAVKGLRCEDQRVAEIEALARAGFGEAVELGERSISPSALFAACMAVEQKNLSDLFSKYHLNEADFRNAVVFGRLSKGLGRKMRAKRGSAAGMVQAGSRVNRAWTSRPTSYLDTLSDDLTDKAHRNEIGFLVGHEEEYRAMLNILSRPNRNNVILVGDEDIGKSAIVEHLAHEIARDNVPSKLFDKRLVALDTTRLSAGAASGSEILKRFKQVTEEIIAAGNIVLYIPDIHTIEQLNNKGEISVFEALEALAAASQIPLIGDTTPRLYRQIIELNQKFVSLFETVKMRELDQDETVRLLVYESYALENEWRIIISYPAIRKTVELAYQFLRQKPLPRASLDLLQETLAEAHSRGDSVLTPEAVVSVVARKTNIPIAVAHGTEAKQLLDLETKIHERFIDQDEAVKAVAAALRQYRAGLARQKGPIATFLFVGPTGVGKTELSKALAELYFGSEAAMIRFDMSEYQDQKAVAQFIGSPDGAAGGAFVEAVKQKPFSLILLDEFEKANSQLIDIFLPIFDEGKITDTLSREIDFKNTIIICTSNANSQYIKEQIEQGKAVADFSGDLKRALVDYFKPELLNRFDGIIAFRQLGKDEIGKIVALNIRSLAKQVMDAHGIVLQVSDEALVRIAELGYDPVFGARPLRGVISTKIKDPLARRILDGSVRRNDTVRVADEKGDITLAKA